MDPEKDSSYFSSYSRSASPALPLSRRGSSTPNGLNVPSPSDSPSTSSSWGFAGYTAPSRKFLGKHLRKLSTTLPSYIAPSPTASAASSAPGTPYYGPHSKRHDGYIPATGNSPIARLRRIYYHRRFRPLAIVTSLLLLFYIFAFPPLLHFYRRTTWLGGGHKFVIILAANKEGGVMAWKGAKEWAAERESIANKKHYANKWGYHLEIRDVRAKKRYAHEWREGWEKVDVVKEVMKKYPKAEWFWWLDLHTYVMEHSYSLQSHIFNNLNAVTYRDINLYNPLNISHPLTPAEYPYLTAEELSPVGDGKPDSINIIVPQDCGGFNLGSFFVRRSEWTTRLLDIWWDPVAYEQRHMQWEHKEQDALEHLYTNQPWIRAHTAFIPQRMINAFPPGACAEAANDPRIFYNKDEHDFLVNMAGCEWGRDCWGEMYGYKLLAREMNRGFFERLWRKWTGNTSKK